MRYEPNFDIQSASFDIQSVSFDIQRVSFDIQSVSFDIQSVSFDRFPEHGSCHSIFPADAGFLCDQAALIGENMTSFISL